MADSSSSEIPMKIASRYRKSGRFAVGMAKGKIASDPAYKEVIRHLGDEGQLLDIGCGEGYLMAYTREVKPLIRLMGVDIDRRRLDVARLALGDEPNLEICEGDIREVDLPPSNVVTVLDVLHYLPVADQDAALDRLARVLEPGGLLLIRDADASQGIRSRITEICERIAVGVGRHKGIGVHMRPAEDTRARLTAAGLDVEVRPCSEGTPFANVMFVARRA